MHIGQVFRHVKESHILGMGCYPVTMANVADAAVQSSGYLCNFHFKLV